jgi:hypothetical protein
MNVPFWRARGNLFPWRPVVGFKAAGGGAHRAGKSYPGVGAWVLPVANKAPPPFLESGIIGLRFNLSICR